MCIYLSFFHQLFTAPVQQKHKSSLFAVSSQITDVTLAYKSPLRALCERCIPPPGNDTASSSWHLRGRSERTSTPKSLPRFVFKLIAAHWTVRFWHGRGVRLPCAIYTYIYILVCVCFALCSWQTSMVSGSSAIVDSLYEVNTQRSMIHAISQFFPRNWSSSGGTPSGVKLLLLSGRVGGLRTCHERRLGRFSSQARIQNAGHHTSG